MGKLQDKILEEKRRRARRQKDGRISRLPVKLKASVGERATFTEHNGEVLLAIESTICSSAQAADCDDSDVEAVIRAVLERVSPTSQAARQMVEALEVTRDLNQYSEEIWHSGLRIIYRSLTTTSKCRRGETSYLTYASKFVADMTRATRRPSQA